MQYRFSEEQGKLLYKIPRLYITNNGEIFDSDNNFIDRYVNPAEIIAKPNQPTTFQPFPNNYNQDSNNNYNTYLAQDNVNLRQT